jgi:hypothetical protein
LDAHQVPDVSPEVLRCLRWLRVTSDALPEKDVHDANPHGGGAARRPGLVPPGSDTSIQKRAVSMKRLRAASPAYLPVMHSGCTIGFSV